MPPDGDAEEGQAVPIHTQLRHLVRRQLCRVAERQVLAPRAGMLW